MTDTLDSLEQRAPQERERDLMARLPALIALAQGAPGWGRILAGVDAAGVDSRAALARLPVTRKSDLKHLQQQHKPFRVHQAWLFVAPGLVQRKSMEE